MSLAAAILNCGSLDINYLEEMFSIAEKLGACYEDIINPAEESGTLKLNNLLFYCMDFIQNEVVNLIIEKLDEIEDEDEKERINEVIKYFEERNFFINYIDTHFNNVLDHINWDASDLAEEVIESVVYELDL